MISNNTGRMVSSSIVIQMTFNLIARVRLKTNEASTVVEISLLMLAELAGGDTDGTYCAV